MIEIKKLHKQDQGSQAAPQGCKIFPCNSTELNFGFFNKIALVETIKYNSKWPNIGQEMCQHSCENLAQKYAKSV